MTKDSSELTFEERLKNKKLENKKHLIIKLSVIITTFLLLAVYFLIPFSHVANCKISGTKYYTNDQILTIAGIEKSNSLYAISSSDIKAKLDESPLLGNDTKVIVTPFGMSIKVNEIYPVFHCLENGSYYFNNEAKIDETLLNSSDALIGEFLNSNITKTVDISFEPNQNNIAKREYKMIVNIVSSLNDDNRNLIFKLNYNKNDCVLSIYYKYNATNEFVKLNCDLKNTMSENGLPYILTKEQIEKVSSDISSNKLKPRIEEEDENKIYALDVLLKENENYYFATFEGEGDSK